MRVRQIKWSGGSNCHCAILYLPEGKLCSRTSRILFLRYFALQFIPLLRLLVSSSHFLFITTRLMLVFGLMVPGSNPVFAITPIFLDETTVVCFLAILLEVQWCIYVLQPLHLPWVFTVVLLNQLGVCYGLICMATSNNYCRSIHCLCWFQTFSAI